MIREPDTVKFAASGEHLEEQLAQLPNSAAVFVLHTAGRDPYLARTGMLRRRLVRLLKHRDGTSRLLNLRSIATGLEYWLTASRLESSLIHYQQAKRYFPESYLDVIKLRMPPYVKLVLSNQFPRAHVTSRISASQAMYFGPFRTRVGAEEFQARVLDLFQLRRCQEDLDPSPHHPGCIYGEMNMCLRPCQQVVGPEEYASEVHRVAEFLSSGGRTLLEAAEAARDRFSAEMEFENAARQHARYERIQNVLKLRDELVADLDRLNGIAVTRSVDPVSVELWTVWQGCWQTPQRFRVAAEEGAMVPMDRRLREVLASVEMHTAPPRVRQEHTAILARWFYSSWRDGEWLAFDTLQHVPYRRLVRAVSRIASGTAPLGNSM